MQVDGALEKKPGYLFAFKNFSYTRSFLPLQFWNSSLKLDAINKEVQIQVKNNLNLIQYKFTRLAVQELSLHTSDFCSMDEKESKFYEDNHN